MKYISQLNAFEDFLQSNHLTGTEQLLWYKLMALNNKFGWSEWFFVTNQHLMYITGGITEPTLIKARNKLKQVNLIDFITGKKGAPSKYKIIKLNAEEKINTKENTKTILVNPLPKQRNTKIILGNPLGNSLGNPLDNKDLDIDLDINRTTNVVLSGSVQTIIEAWNKLNIKSIQSIKHQRLKHFKARIDEHGMEKFLAVISNVSKSDFLKGKNDRSWTISFDWLVNPSNFIKVLEGKYNNKETSSNGYTKHSNARRDYPTNKVDDAENEGTTFVYCGNDDRKLPV